MCGIAGWLNIHVTREEASQALARMCASIRYRGPDDQGAFVGEGVALGMQRLSIVDLDGGQQPMASDDGVIQLVFNGEIYNHVSLRESLKRRGAQFYTNSDTEIILRAYEADGVRGFESFNGMFAIALWDGHSRTLHLVRDRLGVKPLYFAHDGERLVFASEIKALLASGYVAREINPRAVWDFMTSRYVPSPETIWRGVFKLPPGHLLSVALGDSEPKARRWWDMPFEEPQRNEGNGDFVEEFGKLFESAVDLRMVADVPVGILLSGGLDSSAVAAAAARGGAQVETFSVAFDGAPDIDERSYARMVASHLGTKHHEVVIGQKDFIGFLPELVDFSDEPLADLASVPLYYVSRLARTAVKVVLSGEGSDEILGGYTFDRWVAMWDRARQARSGVERALMRSRLGAALGRVSPAFASRRGEAAVETDLRCLAEPLVMTNLATSAEKRSWFRNPVGLPDSLDRVRNDLGRIGDQDPLNQALYVYCQDWLVEDLLMKADRMSMANSLELRTPFLDYRLVEWAWRAPSKVKVGRDEFGRYATKLVLRQYARKRLPDDVIDRPKLGFPVPVYGWLSGELSNWARDILGPGARVRDWFFDSAIDTAVGRGTSANADSRARHLLWNFLVLEHWMCRWLT
jgi:asparagine synthase (glutamine-hydrolysing)